MFDFAMEISVLDVSGDDIGELLTDDEETK